MDTVVWQLLASVACPGYSIHTVVALVHAALLPIEVRMRRSCQLVLVSWRPCRVCGGYHVGHAVVIESAGTLPLAERSDVPRIVFFFGALQKCRAYV